MVIWVGRIIASTAETINLKLHYVPVLLVTEAKVISISFGGMVGVAASTNRDV